MRIFPLLKFPNTRVNDEVRPGQVWQSSDPRRLSAFKIIDVDTDAQFVVVDPVFPKARKPGSWRVLRLEAFQTLGAKGYVRIS